MQFLTLVLIVFSLPVLLALPASATNGISVNPPVINAGETVNITVTTELSANGTLTVTDPNGTSWSAPLNITGTRGGTQTWTFPENFTGANTTTDGSYNITAAMTMNMTGTRTWNTEFKINFIVIPEFSSTMFILFAITSIVVLSFRRFKQKTNKTRIKNTVKIASKPNPKSLQALDNPLFTRA